MNRFGNQLCIPRRRLITEQLEDRRLLAGPYAPAAGEVGSTAVAKDDPSIEAWAVEVSDYSPGSNVDAVFQAANNAIGPAEGNSSDTVSLGRNGKITLTFETPIRDGSGADFVVFENSVNDTFLELGYVEVSSDGTNFFRFESDSLTESPVDSFGQVDPTKVNNLAGKYRQGYGTPFDLQELAGVSPLLNPASVSHVRVVDIVGDGSQSDASGDAIYDPFPTTGSAGLDLDAIGVIHQARSQAQSARDVIGFEDVGATLPPASAFPGPDPNGSTIIGPFGSNVVVGSFQSETLRFNNAYSIDFESWNGWAYSNATNTSTPGFTNQFSSFAGGGASGSPTFGVGYVDQGNFFDPPTIQREASDGRRFESLMVTNTTYAGLSMRDGDLFAKKFGGPSGNDPDFFLLTITGKDAEGSTIGSVDFYLADYRFADNSKDYIVDEWTLVNLATVAEARSLEFSIDSSDVGPFGINTPAFFAVDEIALTRPSLQIEIADSEVSESAGDDATVVRISRLDSDTTMAIDVDIATSDTETVLLATSVTIPAGAQFVEFPIDVVDNDLHQTDRSIVIEASSDGFVSASDSLTIRDDDPRRLTLSLNQTSVEEGNSVTGRVNRNDADLNSVLTVQIQSTDSTVVSSNATVMIAAGQSSANFTIFATDDQIDRPNTQVSLSISAVGYIGDAATLNVSDNDLPTVFIEIDQSMIGESTAAPSARLEDLGRQLPPESFYNGADSAGGFNSGGLNFNNEYDPMFGSWSGWSYSNTTDKTTPGFFNQYSAVTGIGASESDTYAVASAYNPPKITRDPATSNGFQSIAISNTTYATLSMLQGDDFAKKFGGPSGDDPDFFLLTIEGVDEADASVGTIEFYLADYRFSDNRMDYIVDEWTTVDLSPISAAVQLKFSLSSSDVGSFGMNTPAYFAADNVALKGSTVPPTVTIRRNTIDNDDPLVVTLLSNDRTEAILPQRVTIPGGATTAFAPLTIVDDDLVDGNQIITLSATAALHAPFSTAVTILDDESASLSLSIPTGVLSEFNGAGRAVLHRNVSDTSLPLIVELSVDLENQLTLPDFIVIPAGDRSIEFAFAPQDNSIIDDDRTVVIQAMAEGYSSAESSLLIINDDVPPPALSLELNRESLSESDAPLTIQLEDVGATLMAESFNNGAALVGGFESGVAHFNNTYEPTFGSWGGWSFSNSTDGTTPGFTNQYSAISGIGANDSATYALASAFPGGTVPTISLADNAESLGFESLMVTNSTYAALSMAEGDDFAKKFGGETGDDPDFFRLTIQGWDGNDNSVGTVQFYLADYRFTENSQDYIVDQWTAVDVSSLHAATRLEFSLSSSDVGEFGMNTPAYFAIDNIVLGGGNEVVATGTVTRSGVNLDDPLDVSLGSDDSSEVVLQSSVTIPSGERSVTFGVRAVDDAVADGDRTVRLSVTADDFESDNADFIVEDDDLATLTISLVDDTVGESDGESATSLLVHRNTQDIGSPLSVTLSVTGKDLQVPDVITIPAGVYAQSVEIDVTDNMALDGERSTTLKAVAEGFVTGIGSLHIQDDEVANLIIAESGDSTIVEELLGADSFSISLSAQPASSVFVDLNFIADDIVLDVNRLEFTPQQWDQPQVVTARGTPDLVPELDEVVVVRISVDTDASDTSFTDVPDGALDVTVKDYQPSRMRLAEDEEGIHLTDEEVNLRIASASHLAGIEVVANQLDQTIVVDPLVLTSGPVQVDVSDGEDTVILRGMRFSFLDGGEDYDQLVLSLDQSFELVDFLDGRVDGFEEILLASEVAAELLIDMRLVDSVSPDDGTLLIRLDPNQNVTFLGSATLEEPIILDGDFTQVVGFEDARVNLISQTPWQNVLDRWDVNASGIVTSLDALVVVNQIARVTDSTLPLITSLDQFPGMYYDVSGDGELTSVDALHVINEVARRKSSIAAEWISTAGETDLSEDQPTNAREVVVDSFFSGKKDKLVIVSSMHDQAIRQLYAAKNKEAKAEQPEADFCDLQSINWLQC